jgi:polyphenol oxidase
MPIGPFELIRPDWPVPPGVHALTTTRSGGCSEGAFASLNLGAHVGDRPEHVARNRAVVTGAGGLPEPARWTAQVHGTAIAGEDDPTDCTADGRYAARPGHVCAVLTADCLPLLLASRDGTEVAAVHCGWRGLAGGIVARAVARFRCAPGALLAWLGPAIGVAAYRVGPELPARFPPAARSAFIAYEDGLHLDLDAATRSLLGAAGVTAAYGGGRCTAAEPARFYSHRRDGITGRMGTFIWRAAAGR